MRAASRYIALFCLLLTLGSAVAVVTHHHSGPEDGAKCTVCVTAHSARPSVSSSLSPVSAKLVSAVRVVTVRTQQLFVSFALYVRPPPQV
jgi:hypothetical protein